ncbi:hypothetical protein B0H12DRAFT_1103665 [Mycena haematopus]|nr:hypothetical protein B0H12DRAFT_1103665 [Mycena haematopus]
MDAPLNGFAPVEKKKKVCQIGISAHILTHPQARAKKIDKPSAPSPPQGMEALTSTLGHGQTSVTAHGPTSFVPTPGQGMTALVPFPDQFSGALTQRSRSRPWSSRYPARPEVARRPGTKTPKGSGS